MYEAASPPTHPSPAPPSTNVCREQSVQALLSVEIKAINFPPSIVQRWKYRSEVLVYEAVTSSEL